MVVDTNVLVRFVTRDVPDLAERASGWIVEAGRGELVVEEAVLEELTFVLAFHDSFRLPRRVIYRALKQLADLPSLRMSAAANQAIEVYGLHPKLDFVDCLIAVKGGMKHKNVLTFDKDLQKILR